MNKNKATRIIRSVDGESTDELMGMCSPDNEIMINIEQIWNKTKNSKSFIDQFSKILMHEYVHYTIRQLRPDRHWTNYGEEKVVRTMCNQKFSKHDRKYYKEQDKV